jgi:hypothetical protein
MSITKQQLVDQVCQLLTEGAGIRIYGPASNVITVADRKLAESKSVEFLENALLQLQKEQIRIAAANSTEVQQINEARRRDQEQFQRDMAWNNIFRTVLPGNKIAVDNAANRGVIESWLHPHETLSAEVFLKAITETPRLVNQLVLQSADVLDPKKQRQAASAQAEEDRRIFENTAKRFELYSINEANWNVIHSTLGPGLSEFQIQNAVDSGAVRLTPATSSEIQEWRQELAEQRADYLTHHASPAELRAAANQESEQRRLAAAQQQADQQLEAAIVRDSVMGFPPLPEDWRGQKLDATFIKMCDVATHKLLLKRFGSAQLDMRLRGVK